MPRPAVVGPRSSSDSGDAGCAVTARCARAPRPASVPSGAAVIGGRRPRRRGGAANAVDPFAFSIVRPRRRGRGLARRRLHGSPCRARRARKAAPDGSRHPGCRRHPPRATARGARSAACRRSRARRSRSIAGAGACGIDQPVRVTSVSGVASAASADHRLHHRQGAQRLGAERGDAGGRAHRRRLGPGQRDRALFLPDPQQQGGRASCRNMPWATRSTWPA